MPWQNRRNSENRAALETAKRQVIAALRAKTFRAFPATAPLPDVRVDTDWVGGRVAGSRFSFNSEAGWRLSGRLTTPKSVPGPAPVAVILRSPGEEFHGSEKFAQSIWLRAPWATAVVEPRGTGETEWGQSLQLNLRRSTAWTGRTIASMQVYDVLCALRAVRSMPQINGNAVALAARGEMAAVALYAALLDAQIRTLFLESPPATQNAPSQADGRGPAIEMLNCLRITDLPQVAGLLYPAELVLVGEVPSTYEWAEDLYRRLGSPGTIHRVAEMKDWRPGLPG